MSAAIASPLFLVISRRLDWDTMLVADDFPGVWVGFGMIKDVATLSMATQLSSDAIIAHSGHSPRPPQSIDQNAAPTTSKTTPDSGSPNRPESSANPTVEVTIPANQIQTPFTNMFASPLRLGEGILLVLLVGPILIVSIKQWIHS